LHKWVFHNIPKDKNNAGSRTKLWSQLFSLNEGKCHQTCFQWGRWLELVEAHDDGAYDKDSEHAISSWMDQDIRFQLLMVGFSPKTC
jgi:hypothetical protein